MKERILICDKQTEFVMALQQELAKALAKTELEVQAFNDVDRLLENCRLYESKAAFIGEQFLSAFETEALLERTERIIYLTEDKKRDGIFKYQPITGLVREIIEKLLETDEGFGRLQSAGLKGAQIIGIYSPVRPILQSTLALTLGQVMAAEKRVLYLNFEPYSGMEYLMQREFSQGLTDLFFYISSPEERLAMRIETLVEKVGKLDYIPPAVAFPDIEEFGAQGLLRLIDRVSKETEYEVLILDLSEIGGIYSLLLRCDRILCPYCDDPLARAKVDAFENTLDYLKLEAILEKTKLCRLPEFSRLPREMMAMGKSEMADYIRQEILG